ncbi:MAG: 50S ribosomal protein L6 [candidate division Zixibacteria bacterium]|nr:50S ribosomal protein L6 [candidate division Zixibacteria bacterium]
MSRIGKIPIEIVKDAKVELKGRRIEVKGPKGNLDYTLVPGVDVAIEGDQIIVTRKSDSKTHRSLHGLTRALINNMVIGVTKGFQKKLEIHGVGYRAELQGKYLKLNLGFSHDILVQSAPGIEFSLEGNTKITVSGYDKKLVGESAALIRSFRRPEPYKGKGIRYENEHVRRKAGKTAGA